MNQDHTVIYILGALLLVSIVQHIRVHIQLRHLHKQYNMAAFSDIETALTDLSTAASSVQTAVTALVSSSAGSITPAQGDTIVAGIQAATTALNSITASITPAV